MIRLLIADDEALERETLADIVARRFEHEVTIETAENGRKAADTAVLWGADLILMDIEMPGMNGLDAARAVLEQRPECKVIFVTAYSLFQYAHEAMHLGACDYLLKPVNPDEVEASIRKAIRQIEAGRRLAELAPVEPEPEADPEDDAAEAGENDRNALVMAHVRKYMEDNYMFDLSLDSVSEILHISPAYLSAQFKKYQKMNFLDCLTELRINAAKELLTDPFRSAAEVASMVGYEDSSYFARTFKKRTGMTPTGTTNSPAPPEATGNANPYTRAYMSLKIVTYPNPLLGKPSLPITEVTDEIRKLAEEMTEAMYKSDGIGIAAPQVGQLIRLVIIDVTGPEKREGKWCWSIPYGRPFRTPGMWKARKAASPCPTTVPRSAVPPGSTSKPPIWTATPSASTRTISLPSASSMKSITWTASCSSTVSAASSGSCLKTSSRKAPVRVR